jgi:monoamine oxidase
MKRVAIVGGGPSALFTAFLLEQKSSEDLDITLFEQNGRLGGKVQTARFDAAPILYEAGVAELYRYGDDPLYLLVTQHLGLGVREMTGDLVVFEGRVLSCDADIATHFGEEVARAVRKFRRQARSLRTFQQFYDGGWPGDNEHPWANRSLKELLSRVRDPIARRYIEVLIHSDLATEPHVTSGLYGIDNYLINEPDYCQLYAIEGGIGRLISTLAEGLSARVHLRTRVLGVEKGPLGTYRLEIERDGGRSHHDFDAVVMGLPTYALRQVTFGGTFLRRAADRHVGHYDDPAHYLRITALFREPFWRGTIRGSFFIFDAFGGCCVYDEGTRHPAGNHGVLSFLLSGSDALAMSTLDDEALVRRAVDSLPPVIAAPGAALENLIEGHVHRYIGTVSGRPGGGRVEGAKKRHRPEPEEHPGLFFAGDYLFDATVNGAFDSADIAASLLMDHLRIQTKALKGRFWKRVDAAGS